MICKASHWTGFLYDRDICHERVKGCLPEIFIKSTCECFVENNI